MLKASILVYEVQTNITLIIFVAFFNIEKRGVIERGGGGGAYFKSHIFERISNSHINHHFTNAKSFVS